MTYFEEVVCEIREKLESIGVETPNFDDFAHDMVQFKDISEAVHRIRETMDAFLADFSDLALLDMAMDGAYLLRRLLEFYALAGIDFDCLWENALTTALRVPPSVMASTPAAEIFENARKMSDVLSAK